MRTVSLLALGIPCAAAFAGPPFLTDDPEPVALHHAEINLIGQQTVPRPAARATLRAS